MISLMLSPPPAIQMWCSVVCCSVLQRVAACCSVLLLPATPTLTGATRCNALPHPATYCNTLHYTATHSTTLQHTATHCSTQQRTATHCNALQRTATHCNALQRTATHCIELQHTATHTATCCICNTKVLESKVLGPQTLLGAFEKGQLKELGVTNLSAQQLQHQLQQKQVTVRCSCVSSYV